MKSYAGGKNKREGLIARAGNQRYLQLWTWTKQHRRWDVGATGVTAGVAARTIG